MKSVEDYGLKDGTRIEMRDYNSYKVEVDLPKRSCLSYITTNSVDEEGEAVLPEGIQASRFVKTGTVFWNHDYGDPVAVCKWIKPMDTGLMAMTEFPERPEGHDGEWRPDTVLALVSAGLCKGISIGFGYLETREPTTKDKSKFPNTGNELRRVVSKSRLLEYSFAPLPMNEDAVVLATRKGLLTEDGRLSEKVLLKSKGINIPNTGGITIKNPSGLQLQEYHPVDMVRIEIDRLRGKVYK
jgi:phage head maturation protease